MSRYGAAKLDLKRPPLAYGASQIAGSAERTVMLR